MQISCNLILFYLTSENRRGERREGKQERRAKQRKTGEDSEIEENKRGK